MQPDYVSFFFSPFRYVYRISIYLSIYLLISLFVYFFVFFTFVSTFAILRIKVQANKVDNVCNTYPMHIYAYHLLPVTVSGRTYFFCLKIYHMLP